MKSIQYQSNCGMDNNKGNSNTLIDPKIIIDILPITKVSEDLCNFLYFDLETSGFGGTADILQIAIKVQDQTFNVYINPFQLVDPKA